MGYSLRYVVWRKDYGIGPVPGFVWEACVSADAFKPPVKKEEPF